MIETVRAVVAAFAQGKIVLETPERMRDVRYAPSFIVGVEKNVLGSDADPKRAYTGETLARSARPNELRNTSYLAPIVARRLVETRTYAMQRASAGNRSRSARDSLRACVIAPPDGERTTAPEPVKREGRLV